MAAVARFVQVFTALAFRFNTLKMQIRKLHKTSTDKLTTAELVEPINFAAKLFCDQI